jgi:glycosyltransferase involved in cell wall biosynthesis
VRKEKPDILMGNGVLASFLLRLFPESPFKIWVIYHLCHASKVNGPGRYKVWGVGLLERLALHLVRLDRIALTNLVAKDILARKGFSPDSITVVGNGVDVADYSFITSKTPHSLIYVGRLAEFRRVDSLLGIIPFLAREFPDVRLHFVGDGPKREVLQRKIASLGLGDRVVLHGYLPEGDKIALLQYSAVYVSNSNFQGFGIPLVEAMAAGAGPVVSDIGAHRFIFQGREAGFLVNEPEEMVLKTKDLFYDKAKRQQLPRIPALNYRRKKRAQLLHCCRRKCSHLQATFLTLKFDSTQS